MTSPHNRAQQDYFSTRQLPRMEAERADSPYVQRHTTELLSAVGANPNDRILDLGCGPGKYTLALANLGFSVEGLDLTPRLVELLREARPEIPAHVADAAQPPRDLHGRFDLAVGFFFLHHVADLSATLTGVRTVLTHGGRAAFLEPNPLFLGYYLQIALTPGMKWRGERGILRMRPRLLERAARTAGFNQFGCHSFGAAPPRVANKSCGRSLERTLERIPGWQHVGAFRLFWMA